MDVWTLSDEIQIARVWSLMERSGPGESWKTSVTINLGTFQIFELRVTSDVNRKPKTQKPVT